MLKDTPTIRDYFAKFGLEPEIADLYLTLHTYGPQTISALSRNAGIERTRVYRLLDTLTTHNLIETETHYKRVILKAAPITNLQILLSQREQELRTLETELERLHHSLEDDKIMHSPLTRVQFYHGPEGIKQMLWNETRAKTEALGILYDTIQTRSSLAFFERWVRECNKRGMTTRSIVSDHFLQDLQKWYAKHSNERLNTWEARYLAPSTFPITHSTVTYDNVMTYYNWRDDDLFGIEVYNEEIARTHRNIFAMLWAQAANLKDELQTKPWER